MSDSELDNRSPRYGRSGKLVSPFNGVMVKASFEAAILGERIASFVVARSGMKLMERSLRAGQMGLRRGVWGMFEIVGAGFTWSEDMLDGFRDIFGGLESMFGELRGNMLEVSGSINESFRVSFGVVYENMIAHSKYT
jgi:hypothetical protein